MCMPRPGVGPYIKRINDWLAREANRNLRELNLTRTQGHLLMALYRQPTHSASLKELETLFQVAQPTMAGIASRLEAKHLVERIPDPHDRRVKHLRLTEYGCSVCLASREDILSAERKLASALNEEEQAEFKRLLQLVYDALQDPSLPSQQSHFSQKG